MKTKRSKSGGRSKGTPNKVTATIKMMLLEALDKVGGTKYLIAQAKANPVAFLSLIGRVMPTQVVGDVTHQFVAQIPPPEKDTDQWLKRYAPSQTQLPH